MKIEIEKEVLECALSDLKAIQVFIPHDRTKATIEAVEQALKQAHVSGQLPPDERGTHPTRDWG